VPSVTHLLPTLSIAILICVGFGVSLVVPTVWRLLKPSRIEDISSDWLETFTVRAYDPMDRLLSDEDFRFLYCQPGFDLALYRKLRRDRLQIFREYLHRMISDFNRLHLIARVLVARAPEDQSHLVIRLIVLKARFSVEVLRAQAGCWLCWFSIRTIGVRTLISQMEELSATLGPAFSA
jgi:hypothetical protein